MQMSFYDIETLYNVFTVAYFIPDEDNPHVVLFYHVDNDALIMDEHDIDTLKQCVYKSNRNFKGDIYVYNLRTPFGLAVFKALFDPRNNRNLREIYSHMNGKNAHEKFVLNAANQFKFDIDTNFDEKIDTYLGGYNSYNYDTNIIAFYLQIVESSTTSDAKIAKCVRDWSDVMFKPEHINSMASTFKDVIECWYNEDYYDENGMAAKEDLNLYNDISDYTDMYFEQFLGECSNIRERMMQSGRYLDVARLNEKQVKVGLKRLLGMLGYQIMESDKLGGEGGDSQSTAITTKEELFDLLAYNVSDVVNLEKLFEHPAYKAQFELKQGLIRDYPELVFKCDSNFRPTIDEADPHMSIRRDRLRVDSSSAQFATKTLAPYTKLLDLPVVSFDYPETAVAARLGIEQINVLDECQKFFNEYFPDPNSTPRQQIDPVFDYYRNIEGRNFNNSATYNARIADIRDHEMHLMYPDRTPAELSIDEKAAAFMRFEKVNRDVALEIAKNYRDRSTAPAICDLNDCNEIPRPENCIPYFDKNGSPTTCFATFSTGGIHGAELDGYAYLQDLQQSLSEKTLFEKVMQLFNDYPEEFKEALRCEGVCEADLPQALYERHGDPGAAMLKRAKKVEIDGVEYEAKRFLKSTSTMKKGYFKKTPDLPQMFTGKTNAPKNDKSTKLNKKYNYTSVGVVQHDDFKSYYPNLLRLMAAFENPDLYDESGDTDRYVKFYEEKERLGGEIKATKAKLAQAQTDEEKDALNAEALVLGIRRSGNKLILNSASGAGDTAYDSNIRMNNRIISMRIIGQLFSWRIGQSQTFEGNRIPSTNTDGLYVQTENDARSIEALDEQAKIINVDIEPERLYLISKDSNNRIEIDIPSGNIISASGGSLACWKDTDPTKSLAHPAIIDWALAQYLKAITFEDNDNARENLRKPFDYELGRQILESAPTFFHDEAHLLRMFSHIISSSRGSMSYVFTTDENGVSKNVQHYNRIFIMKPQTPNTVSVQIAAASLITPAMAKKRPADEPTQHNPLAVRILRANGIDIDVYNDTPGLRKRDAVVKKVTGIEPEWPIRIDNRDLFCLSKEERTEILENLDLDAYLNLVANSYTRNWKNTDLNG